MKPAVKNKLCKSLLTLALLMAGQPLWGEQKKIPAKDIRSIVIKAVHLNIKIQHKPSALYSIQWSGDLSFETEKKALTIQSSGFNSPKSWTASAPSSPVTLEISGPSRPLQLFSLSSHSVFSQWTEPVFISSFKGSVKANKSKGSLEISLKEGDVNIRRQTGSLTVHGWHVNLLVSSSQGRFQFYINEGLMKVKKSKGDLNFTTDKAKIRISQFKGNLKGSSQSGAITATIQPDKVDLSTKQSPLRLSFMGQAPKITAYTEKGEIYGARAKHLYKQFSGKSTKVSGRIRGSVKKGIVSLRTETGNIYIN